MNSTTRTTARRANPTIKAILAIAFPGRTFRGREVTVIEAESDWAHTQYFDDLTHVAYLTFTTNEQGTVGFERTKISDRTTPACPTMVHGAPIGSNILVIHSLFLGAEFVEIVIPRELADDSPVRSVAIDAALEGRCSRDIFAEAMPGSVHLDLMTAVAEGAALEIARKAKTKSKKAA